MNEHDEVVECKLASEKRWTEMRLEIQRIKDDLDVLKVRLDKQAIMVQDIQQLSTSVALLANSVELTAKNIEKITKRIETLESKPLKRWETVIQSIINIALTILLGYVAVKLGIS